MTGGDSNGAILGREALYENRVVTLRVQVVQQATQDLAQAKIGALVDKLQEAEKGGIDCVWTPANSTKSGTLKVLLGEIVSLPVVMQGDDAGWMVNAPVAEIELTCKPGIRGAEVAGTPTASTLPLMTVELTGVTGDLPADGRLIVTDSATQSRRHVEWGLESRYYPTSSPPSLIVDSDSLVTAGFAGTGTTRAGAYDPGAAGNSVIRGTLATQAIGVCGTGVLPHVGTFRVKARVYGVASDTSSIYVRLAWQDGDGPWRANSYTQLPVVNAFAEVDLGMIRVDPVSSGLGTQRWQGRIEAYSSTVGDTVDVDYMLLVPAAEGYALVRGEYSYVPGVLVARDEFTSIASGTALNARVAPSGGTWATSGAATDFAAADLPTASDETMARSTTAAEATPRWAVLGATNYTNTEVGVDVRADNATLLTTISNPHLIVGARWVDSSNYLRLRLGQGSFTLSTIVAGVTVAMSSKAISAAVGTWFKLRLVVFTSGAAIGTLLDSTGTSTLASVKLQHSSLATGGALATGKPLFADQLITAAAGWSRYYDNFYAATPDAEPIAIYSTQSLEVRSDTAKREDSTGVYYGDPPSYRGSRFTVPPAGAGSRKARIAVKARRNDVAVNTDDQIADNLTVTANYSPVWLAVPR